MLGLGDIAVPGLFCALLAKWDAVPTLAELQGSFWCVTSHVCSAAACSAARCQVKMAEGSSHGFTYLNIILLMYILSLITTIAGPPGPLFTQDLFHSSFQYMSSCHVNHDPWWK